MLTIKLRFLICRSPEDDFHTATSREIEALRDISANCSNVRTGQDEGTEFRINVARSLPSWAKMEDIADCCVICKRLQSKGGVVDGSYASSNGRKGARSISYMQEGVVTETRALPNTTIMPTEYLDWRIVSTSKVI